MSLPPAGSKIGFGAEFLYRRVWESIPSPSRAQVGQIGTGLIPGFEAFEEA